MSNDTHNHLIPQVSYSIGDVEFKITGYSAEDAIKIVKNLIEDDSEEKPGPTVNVNLPDNGHNFDRHLQREKHTEIESLSDLQVGDVLMSVVFCAGGYHDSWPNLGMKGVVSDISDSSPHDHEPYYINIEAPNGRRLAFTRNDVKKDFVKVESLEKTRAPFEFEESSHLQTVVNLYDLNEGDEVESTVDRAGGFYQWKKGKRGVVKNNSELGGVWITFKGEDHPYWFTEEEVLDFQQIAKVL